MKGFLFVLVGVSRGYVTSGPHAITTHSAGLKRDDDDRRAAVLASSCPSSGTKFCDRVDAQGHFTFEQDDIVCSRNKIVPVRSYVFSPP